MKLQIEENLYLRELTEADVTKEYLAWLEDEQVIEQTEVRFQKQSLETIKSFVQDKMESRNDFLFGIFQDTRHIGNIKLGPINWNHLHADISYFIGDKNSWGQGIATKSVRRVTRFALDDLGLAKVNASYYSTNIGSALVLEKAHFQLEGIRRSQCIYQGRRISVFEVGLVPSDIP